MMKRELIASAVAGVAAIPVLSFLGHRVSIIESFLAECYLVAASFGTIHSPNDFVYYSVQFLVVALVVFTVLVVLKNARRERRA